ncbi:SDR family NAD(P)-dependent oxidoreductase [Thiohalophilus sp.]|uniref:SDR family NAD(P)-dependent oxidoreductase n=1 Tax=Thiohalophilus sp. TaxID=3028392 RepID=UPI0039753B9E
MDIRLENQTVLVTGAATGIGRAMILAFAQAGANVVINHYRQAPLAEQLVDELRARGTGALAIEADVGRRDEVRAMVEQGQATFGGIDVLVNNAGISIVKPFLEIAEAEWDRILDTNLKSVFHCCQAILPGMLDKGEGVIINIASELGYLGRARFAPYTASKGGVITLTRSLAREFAPNIRINAIAPGPVLTPMLESEISNPDEWEQEMDIPMKRAGKPEEIAATAVFLASEQAGYYCGEVLSPNGGALMR